MKYVFIEKHRTEFSVKPCVVCCGLPAAAGMSGVCAAISPASASSSGASVMLLSVRHSLRQNSFMAHLVSLMNCRSTTLKPSPPACAVRGGGQGLAAVQPGQLP